MTQHHHHQPYEDRNRENIAAGLDEAVSEGVLPQNSKRQQQCHIYHEEIDRVLAIVAADESLKRKVSTYFNFSDTPSGRFPRTIQQISGADLTESSAYWQVEGNDNIHSLQKLLDDNGIKSKQVEGGIVINMAKTARMFFQNDLLNFFEEAESKGINSRDMEMLIGNVRAEFKENRGEHLLHEQGKDESESVDLSVKKKLVFLFAHAEKVGIRTHEMWELFKDAKSAFEGKHISGIAA